MSVSGYEGKVIYESRDEFGELIIAEGAMTRSFYFGRSARQSSMFIDFPSDLTMHYSRAMMSSLIFNPQPRRALLIGLGGGSLVKFLLRACPGCELDVVEIRAKVIQLSHRFFAVPKKHKNIRMINADGRDVIMRCRDDAELFYDLIFVDAYDDAGQVEEVADCRFIEAAKQCLSKNGILVYNLWNSAHGNHHRCRGLVKKIFAGAVLQLVIGGNKSHAIIFALQNPLSRQDLRTKEADAEKLERRFHINFPKFLDSIIRQNY